MLGRKVLASAVCPQSFRRTTRIAGLRTKAMGSDTCARIFNGILGYISRLADPTKKNFTVSVEGNIGSGKTSLLKYFTGLPFVEVYPEPVNKWRNIQGTNALALMYEDPSRWALTFQTYVQLTMLQTHTQHQRKPVKMMERSIYSAKYCFVENLYESGKMPDIEYLVLTRWFDWLVANEDCHLDLIVYLQTKPETVYDRIQQRSRKEETTIPLEYLTCLHNLHEDWLVHQSKHPLPAPVLVLNADGDLVDMVDKYETHKRQILCGYS